MFSQKIYAEIARVTQKALDDMHNATTINQVSVILGYVTLSSRNVPGYDDELRTAIDRLLELARGENQQVLADALAALGQHMDEERPNIASQPVSTKPPPRFEIGDAVCPRRPYGSRLPETGRVIQQFEFAEQYRYVVRFEDGQEGVFFERELLFIPTD